MRVRKVLLREWPATHPVETVGFAMDNEDLRHIAGVLRAAGAWSRDEVATLGGKVQAMSSFCWMRPAPCHHLREKIEAWIAAGRPGLEAAAKGNTGTE